MGLTLSGDYRRPLSEVQRDREAGVLPTPTLGETVDVDEEALNELKRENAEIKSDITNITEAINKIVGATEVVGE